MRAHRIEVLRVGQQVNGQAVRGDGNETPMALATARTGGAHIEVIRRVGLQAVDGRGVGVGHIDGGRLQIHRAGQAVGIFPLRLVAAGRPADGDLVNQGVLHGKVFRVGTSGHIIHEEIVEIDVRAAPLRDAEGHITTVAGIVGRGELVSLPRIGNRHREGLQRHEGAVIVRVGHHTRLDAVTGGSGVKADTHFQAVKRHGIAETRKGSVGIIRGGTIEIERTGAGRGIRGGDVRILRGIVGATEPAVNVCGRTASRGGLKVLDVRHVDVVADRGSVDNRPVAELGGGADASQADIVFGAGSEVREGIGSDIHRTL